MKAFRKARVTLLSEPYLDDAEFPKLADVFVNGSAAAINVGDRRIDRLTNITTSEKKGRDKDGEYTETEISGRSDYLKDMNLHRDDQTVRISVRGGVCLTCR